MNFSKYSSNGNDFILVDNRLKTFDTGAENIQNLCHRNFGIGADGVVLLEEAEHVSRDFKMRIYNADGSLAEMCGNAARAIVHYAFHELQLKEEPTFLFETENSTYEGEINNDHVKILMTEIYDINTVNVSDLGEKRTYYVNTGVPHTVIEVDNLKNYPVALRGHEIRFDQRFFYGTNVDFFEVLSKNDKKVALRIFERGVEGETFCCGTGVVATALACREFFGWNDCISFVIKGGEVEVEFDPGTEKVYFSGEVKHVFSGVLN